jgi:UDP-glucuronate 4-epimerase
MPFSVHDNVDHPLSLYGATKKANELLAHTYAHLFRLPVTGLRIFTVYGPWGRPDMALFTFVWRASRLISLTKGTMRAISLNIDDIVGGVERIVDHIPEPDPTWSSNRPDPATSYAPYRVYNIGNHKPCTADGVCRSETEARCLIQFQAVAMISLMSL